MEILTAVCGILTAVGWILTAVGGILTAVVEILTAVGGILTAVGGILTAIGGILKAVFNLCLATWCWEDMYRVPNNGLFLLVKLHQENIDKFPINRLQGVNGENLRQNLCCNFCCKSVGECIL